MSYRLAVDFGTSFTCAAVASGVGEPRMLNLGSGSVMPSAVFVADDGGLLVGDEAQSWAGAAPERLVRGPKRDLGQKTRLVVGTPYAPGQLVAEVLRFVLEEARRYNDGEEPAELVLTHPASWAGERRLEALAGAAEMSGLPAPQLMSEPEAAARYFADEDVPSGAHIAVYDLGGGTFDTAVLKRRQDGGFELASAPAGDEGIGGEHFNGLLYEHIGAQQEPVGWGTLEQSPEVRHQQARRRLLEDIERAKKDLSRQSTASIYISDPVDVTHGVTREELEALIAGEIERSVEILSRTIAAAGLEPQQLDALYLTGGASRIPLVQRSIEAELGCHIKTRDDPKTIVAQGALKSPPPPFVPEPAPKQPSRRDHEPNFVLPAREGDPAASAGRANASPQQDDRFAVPIVANGVRAAAFHDGSIFAVAGPSEEPGDTLLILRMDPVTSDIEAIEALGDAPPEMVVRVHVTPMVVAVHTANSMWFLNHELTEVRSFEVTAINSTAMGSHALWLREVTGQPSYDEKNGVVVCNTRYERIALDDSVSSLTFDGGLDAFFTDGSSPAGFDVMPVHPQSDEAIAISSRAKRGLRGWKHQQLIAHLSSDLALGARPDTFKIDGEPWVTQMAVVDGRQVVAATDGLYVGWDNQTFRTPSELSLLLNPDPYPFAEWVITKRGAIAVAASETETVIYGFTGTSLEPIATYPTSVVTLPVGSIIADIEGPRHIAALDDERGVWLPLIGEQQGALVHVGDDGTCSDALTFESTLLPAGADDEFLYCLTGRDDGLSDVVAIPRDQPTDTRRSP